MKTRSVGLLSFVCVFTVAAGLAQNPNLGTWKLNEAKSEMPAGMGKTTTVTYATATENMIKITTDGVDAQGKPTHTEWTGKFDKKPYPVTGDPEAPYRAYKQKSERVLLFANMKGDKTVNNGRIEVANDGKSRTVSMTYFHEKKKKVQAKYVYEKE